jgi:serine/threonine protein phosphatase PrpC
MNPSPLHIESAIISDIGRKRKQNQDSAAALPALGFFLVADGMGGHQGGETASQLCVESFCQKVRESSSANDDERSLLTGLEDANREILRQSLENEALQGMGTTATALKISNSRATLLQVGDSRGYFWNDTGLWQLTRDHSLVQEKLRAGLITREQVKTDLNKNVITRSVGFETPIRGDLFRVDLHPGDGFLLCSDGLTGPLDDPEIWEILQSSKDRSEPLSRAAELLVEAANERGGDDNITVILVKVRKD